MRDLEKIEARWAGHVPALMDASFRYAVLCPFAETPEGLSLLLEARSPDLKSHPGEVCFPGGRVEPGETETGCALRETEEELAIPPDRVRLLGLGDFICSVAGFTLQPVLGAITAETLAAVRPSPAEVAESFTVPVSFFTGTPPEVYTYTLSSGGPEKFPYGSVGVGTDHLWVGGQVDVPVWHWKGHAIWGMTARIIRSLVAEPVKREGEP